MFLSSSMLLIHVVLTLCKCDFYFFSRSHAIFTISMKQKRIAGVTSGGGHDDVGYDILGTKLHLVDLERAKKKGADGMRSALTRR